MKFDVKTRGTNTKEHWEDSHNNMFIKNWNGVEGEALKSIIESNWWHYVWAVNDIISIQNVISKKTILDVGCAPNKCLAYYAQKYPTITWTGIDFTDALLDYAKEFTHLSNLKFKKMDFLEEEIPDTYGAILLMETLEHIELGTNWKLVEELLAKCEYLYITVPSDNGENGGEHISHYTLNSFNQYNVLEKKDDGRGILCFKLRGNL